MSTVEAINSEPEQKQVAETTPAPDKDEEPQNPLTQKFTDKEWAALKEFRVRAALAPCKLHISRRTHVPFLSPSSRKSLRRRMTVRTARGRRLL